MASFNLTGNAPGVAPLPPPLDVCGAMVCKAAGRGRGCDLSRAGPQAERLSMKKAARVNAIRKGLGRRCIVLVGIMGAGKSAIGRLLAGELDLPYFDSDAEIVAAADMSIPDIFERFGEDYFRKGEQRVISRLLHEGPCVLSLGGGAFMSEATRREIAENGVSVWLTADLDLLMARVMRRPKSRPLLQTDNPRRKLAELLELRSPVYALADIHVESSRLSKKQTCDNLMKALYQALRDAPASEAVKQES
jgi:shikimate kinase